MILRAFACLLICLSASGTTWAHSKISTSIPAEGATAKAGLSDITLGFSGPVRLMLVKIRNTETKSDFKADFKPSTGFATSFPFKVPPMTAGAYQVNWTAVAKDGHVMKGTLSFKVAK